MKCGFAVCIWMNGWINDNHNTMIIKTLWMEAGKRGRSFQLYQHIFYHSYQGSISEKPMLSLKMLMISLRYANVKIETWQKCIVFSFISLKHSNRSGTNWISNAEMNDIIHYLLLLLYLFFSSVAMIYILYNKNILEYKYSWLARLWYKYNIHLFTWY